MSDEGIVYTLLFFLAIGVLYKVSQSDFGKRHGENVLFFFGLAALIVGFVVYVLL